MGMPPSAVPDLDLASSVHVECPEAAAQWLDKTVACCRPLLLSKDAERGGAVDAPDVKITKQTVRALMLESMDLSAEETVKHKSGCDVVEAEIQRTAQSLTGKLSEAAAFLKLSSAIRKSTGPKRKAVGTLPVARSKTKAPKPVAVEVPKPVAVEVPKPVAVEVPVEVPVQEPDAQESAPVAQDDCANRLKAALEDARRALAQMEAILGEQCAV